MEGINKKNKLGVSALSTGETTENVKLSMIQKLFKRFSNGFTQLEKRLNTENIDSHLKISKYVSRVLYGCLITTLITTSYHVYKDNEFERHYNQQLISTFNSQLDNAFYRYFAMLHGIKAVFSMSPNISLKEWTPYAQQILYPKRYPGIHSISIIMPVYKKDLAAFLEQDRQQNARNLELVSPEDYNRDELAIIQYAASNTSKSWEGLNVRQYKSTRQALDNSRDENKTKMTYVNRLRSEENQKAKPAFVIYTPIYHANTPISNALSRRQNFYGWVAAPIYIKDLFQNLLKTDPDFKKIHMRITVDQEDSEGFHITPLSNQEHTVFNQTLTKTIAGLTFQVHTGYYYPGLTLYGGKLTLPASLITVLLISLVISLLVTAFFWSVLTMRQRALDLANRMTTDLFRQEQKYRTLIQNAPGVIFSCIPERNWRMDYLSGQFKEITGYPPSEFLNNTRRYIEIIHPDDILKIEKTIGLKPQLSHEYFLDYRLIHKNGSVRWMHERAKVVRLSHTKELHLMGYFFDVTEQKEKESEYRNLVNALESAVNGVAFINENGFHLRINEAYSDIMDGNAQELQYKSFFELLSERDQEKLRNIIANGFEDKERALLNVEARTLEGKTLYLSLVIVPAYSDDVTKKMIGFYIFAKDMSNEARRENQLSEAVKAAEAANQTKSTFLATMSHELRTPLNAIIGYSDMLLEDAQDSGDNMIVGDLKKINNSGRHLLSLINDILDVSKLEAGKMTIHLETFDIKEISETLLDIIYPAAKKNNNKVVLNLPDDIGEIYSDLTKLRQMVFNLLSNACKFTKDGTVTFDVKASSKGNREFVFFAVADSGIGITDEQMAKLFQPFSQADSSTTRNFGGTGLGLTITKKFSEILGGEIIVTSKAGVGTTFTLVLPRNTRQNVADEYNEGKGQSAA
ncbi:MAG TPA: hypothetical protein DD412_03100 [Holosporales bacterium]|nr:hypothetical protein [Holosporales bacterium]